MGPREESRQAGGTCTVVMYHYVRPAYTGEGIIGLSVDDFDAQLGALCSRYRMLQPEEFHDRLASRLAFPDGSCLLTFDDGLRDHYDYVLPVLRRHGVAGLFFILTKPLLEGRMATTHKVHLLRQRLGDREFRARVWERLPAKWRQPASDGGAGPQTARQRYRWDAPELAQVKELLNYRLPYPLTDRLIGGLFRRHVGDERKEAARFYLGRPELREMLSAGMAIGGHGHAHRIYARLKQAEQAQDVDRCLDALQQMTGRSVWAFCYPFGKPSTFTPGTWAHLERRGIRCAFASEPGVNRVGDNPYAFKRVDPKDVGARAVMEPDRCAA